jgi:four helix bundle protein
MECAIRAVMIIKSLEVKRDPELRKQLGDCSARVPALISEGFGQGTDRHGAHFQRIARGSSNEMRTHLKVAPGRNHQRPTTMF